MNRETILPISLITWAIILFVVPNLQASDAVITREIEPLKNLFFRIKVVDEQTERGVLLIELTTTNLLSYITDSHGVIAFYEPGLMGREVFFHISGHGYECPKNGRSVTQDLCENAKFFAVTSGSCCRFHQFARLYSDVVFWPARRGCRTADRAASTQVSKINLCLWECHYSGVNTLRSSR